MQILKGGVLYFALVFGAGFMLGTIRTLWVVPRFGTRIAELMEMPIMLIVTIVAARWIALHLAVPFAPFGPPRNGCHRARSPAGRGIRPRALASRPVDQGVSCKPRPCVANGLLFNAWDVCHHAVSHS